MKTKLNRLNNKFKKLENKVKKELIFIMIKSKKFLKKFRVLERKINSQKLKNGIQKVQSNKDKKLKI